MTATHITQATAPALPFTPRLPPLAHQAAFLAAHAYEPAFALHWAPGTGKTKGVLDNFCLLAMDGLVEGCLVLAPHLVHANWVLDEVPKHWPLDAPPLNAFAWYTDKASTKAHQRAFAQFLEQPGPSLLAMSYDGLLTDAGKKASWDFLRSRRVMYVLDEHQRVKTPGTRRTKTVIRSSVYAPYRRILSGTPMDTPFDLYAPLRFLDGDFWARKLGIGNFAAFKAHFGEWVQVPTTGGRFFPQLRSYQHLEELRGVLATVASRVPKEAVTDLPKSWSRRTHPLTPTQRRVYQELRQEAMTLLDSGELVTAEQALVLMLRLTQVGAGHVTPAPSAAPVVFEPNPRAELLREILEGREGQTLIWCRFVPDTRACAEASRRAGRRPAVFDGTSGPLDAFHAGEVDDLIGTLDSSMREGFTLTEADTAIFYSNTTKLLQRQQAEDRNHRIGSTRPVEYIDLVAEGTIDTRALERLRSKGETAGYLMGDNPEAVASWLREALEG